VAHFGLGNPDPEFSGPPHNLGFLAVDELANRGGFASSGRKVKALVVEGSCGAGSAARQPQTYMNLSGVSVRELLAKYELTPDDCS